MLALLRQLQLLLAVFSALLPLAPEAVRARAAEVLAAVARALAGADAVATNLDDLARKLASIRTEVEAMAQSGHDVTVEEMDAAMERVRRASTAFRAAVETAGASAS